MINNVTNFFKRRYSFLFVGSIPLFFIFNTIPIFGDDIYNRQQYKLYNSLISDFNFVIRQYHTWSSRTIINFIMYFFETKPILIFAITTMLMFWLLTFSLSKILNPENDVLKNFVIVLFMYCLPFQEMLTAGWVATTTTYFFPVCVGAFSVLGLFDGFKWKSYKLGKRFLLIIATVYASNNEQVLVFLIILFFLEISRKRLFSINIDNVVYAQVIVLLMSLTWVVLCPGNSLRNNLDIEKYFPEFKQLSLINKIDMISMSTAQHFLYGFVISIFLLFIITSIYFNEEKKKEHLIISIISLVGLLICSIAFLYHCLSGKMNRVFYFPKLGMFYSNQPKIYVAIIVILNLVLLILTFYNISIKTSFKENMFLYNILLAGLVSRIVIFNNATQYVSAARTFFVFEFAIILIALYICLQIIDLGNVRIYILPILSVTALVNMGVLLITMNINNGGILFKYLRLWLEIVYN